MWALYFVEGPHVGFLLVLALQPYSRRAKLHSVLCIGEGITVNAFCPVNQGWSPRSRVEVMSFSALRTKGGARRLGWKTCIPRPWEPIVEPKVYGRRQGTDSSAFPFVTSENIDGSHCLMQICMVSSVKSVTSSGSEKFRLVRHPPNALWHFSEVATPGKPGSKALQPLELRLHPSCTGLMLYPRAT